MRKVSLLPAIALVALSALAAAAQTPTLPTAPGAPQSSSSDKMVRLELADGTGPIMVDPKRVVTVQPSGERPNDWSFIRLASQEPAQATVIGTVPEVTAKLGR